VTILSPHSPVGSAAFLLKSIVPPVADSTNLQNSPTFRFHPISLLSDFTNLQISPTFRFHPVSLDNSEPTLTCGLGRIFAQVHRPHCCRFHQLLRSDCTQFHFCQISPTCRFHQLSDFTQSPLADFTYL